MGIGKRVDDKEDSKAPMINNDKAEKTEQQPEEIFVPVEPKFDFDDIIL